MGVQTITTLRASDGVSTWTVPDNVYLLQGDNTGNGSCGGVNTGGEGGGGGGAFSRTTIAVTPGQVITLDFGSVGVRGGAATPVWWSLTGSQPTNVSEGCLADSAGAAGNGTTASASGGRAANCIGTLKNDGGDGAFGTSPLRGGGGGNPGTADGAGASATGQTGATGAGDGGSSTQNGTDAAGDGCGGGGGGPSGGNSGVGKGGKIVFTYTPIISTKQKAFATCIAPLAMRIFRRFAA